MKRVLLCAALIVWSAVASAVVYKWVDADGKVHYGDRPPDGVHAEVVELLGTRTPPAAPSNASARPARTAPTAGAGQPTVEKEKQAVAADVAATRDQQCTAAQARYKQLIEGRRLYKAGANGEREYLTSEEIDAERLSAKQDVDLACEGTT
jgi:hypothetical protein